MSERIRVAGLENDSITDGPGLRFTVFVQGCDRGCDGCHNPTAQSFDGGQEISAEEIFEKIKKNPLLSGVTFSGGEPFMQAKQLLPLASLVKQASCELAVYSGYTFEELTALNNEAVMPLLKLCDTLIDGPFIKEKRNLSLRFCGSENQRTIDVQRSLTMGRAVLDASGRWE